MRRTIVALRPLLRSQRSILPSTAPSPSRSCALANPPMAEWMQKLHPLRITYELFSDANPMMAMLKPMASWVREHRSAPLPDNPFIGWQENISQQIIAALDTWRDGRDHLAEQMFFTTYGLPALQAALGIDPTSTQPLRRPAEDPWHQEIVAHADSPN